jgi:predicted GIY-YIG superfamily endonuclease
MNLESKETFFTTEGDYDKKNILLRSTAVLTEDEVRKIDSGELTLEDLESLVARKAKIFRYRTQITLHAGFPREVANSVNGYAYLVNNKNGSVGIRYGAIDEVKRRHLMRYLVHEGFHYNKNSTAHEFVLTQRFSDKEEAVEYIISLKTRYDYPALRRLINGSINISGGAYCGMYYVFLTVNINAIRKENIQPFLSLMHCRSEEEVERIEEEKRRKAEDDERKHQAEWEEYLRQKAVEAAAKKEKMLAALRGKHQQVSVRPTGACSLCVITDKAKVVVIKQFALKNGKMVTKQFLQENYGMREFQKWNDVIPAHSAKDTCRLKDTAIERYISQGAVFAL